jgi:hypothetical protein
VYEILGVVATFTSPNFYDHRFHCEPPYLLG